MRIITNEDLRQIVGIKEVMDAYEIVLREYYRGDAVDRPCIDVWSPTSDPGRFYQWREMEGLSRHFGVFATRMMSDIAYFDIKPDGTRTQEKFNTRVGLFCGLIWAFSIEKGTPLALIQDGYLQHLRVAAKAGLAAREVARKDASIVGMLGSGGMARSHLRAFALIRKIERVRVYSPTKDHRDAYAREMEDDLGIPVEPVDSPQAAVRDAHIVACCTSAIEPVLHGSWIPDGAFISVVKGGVELSDDAWGRVDSVVNFSRELGQEEQAEKERAMVETGPQSLSGRFQAYVAGQPDEWAGLPRPLASARQWELATLFFKDVLDGRAPARTDDRQVLALGGGGGPGLQFAAVAGVACQLAEQHGVGRVVPDEWFLQTERD